MKRSIIGQNLTNRLDFEHALGDIPKCESKQQFFILGHARKKKKNCNLATSMTIQATVPTLKPFHNYASNFYCSQQKPCFSDALTTFTDSTSYAQQTISFKKNQHRQKLNRGQKLSSDNLRNCSSLTKKSSMLSPSKQFQKLPNQKILLIPKKKTKWQIQDFVLVKKIGQGTYSEVFLAVQKDTNFICAIKRIRKQKIRAEKIYDVIIRQLKIHHYLKHSNIVQLYGQFDDTQNIYLICQYCTQGGLNNYIKQKNQQGRQPDLLQISLIIRQICEAVSIMHKNFLMHRDIKPQNVFLTMGNIIKLGDFGWSVYYGDEGLRNTQCGTPLYLAPQLITQNQYSQTVDVWAIGVLAYQMLTGQIPFKIRTIKDLAKIINQDIKFQYIENQTARDFVMKLLQRNVKLRKQIQDVLQHPFLNFQEE